ncbi:MULTISPECIES: sensor histidine kinase [Stenotrophomonas]|uniref:histidine kinase n=1 Tax=Stenotrophomonas maltophilia TaxID=40324 RepID=A0A3S0KBV7_STEMA|nr:HAMP domain-containing sensor histidine kinase [Stenotrophomonas maltophilia]RTQ87489.1 HAMP domain-containing histidine kinase [Stenotrophomonas maltophilia]
MNGPCEKPGWRAAGRPLWLWLGLRMSALAIFGTLLIVVGMWCYSRVIDHIQLSLLPGYVAREIVQLRAQPAGNEERLWQLMASHASVDWVLPGLDDLDWLALLSIVALTIPALVLAGMGFARRLSREFSDFVVAAQRVSQGDFSVRVDQSGEAGAELADLASAFNGMAVQLQQYEREVQESSAMLAHELRTPLNAAMGRLQGVLDDVFPHSDEQLQLVLKQLGAINRLVGDLQLVSLARAGQLSLHLERVDIRALIDERLDWALPMLNDAGFDVSCTAEAGLFARADRGRVGQVLSILIDNVLRHAAQGRNLGIVAAASATTIVIEVSDRGPGVPSCDLPRITDRFWRADRSRTRRNGGSGLGLAVASAICRCHGGELVVVGRQGGGLIARLCIPSVDASCNPDEILKIP